MLRNVVLSVIFLAMTSFAQITEADFLRVSTGAANETWNNSGWTSTWDIVNTRGERVWLRGVNAGGWLVMEPWMSNLSVNSGGAFPNTRNDHLSMLSILRHRFGRETRDELINWFQDNYWTEQDFDNIVTMGMNVVRLPFTYMNFVHVDTGEADFHQMRANAFERIDWFLEQAGRRGLYVIPTMHGAFGSQNGMDHSGEINDGWQLYNNPENRRKTLELWGHIARRYARQGAIGTDPTAATRSRANDRPDLAHVIAWFNSLNEPGVKARVFPQNGAEWVFLNDAYIEIRRWTDHIISQNICWDAGHAPRPGHYNWRNVVYQYHYYCWGDCISNAEQQINFVNSKVQDIRHHNHGVPTFVGEFTFFGMDRGWEHGLRTFNEQGWHWTKWTYKVKSNYGSWGIFHHNSNVDVNPRTHSVQEIRDRWGPANVGSRPNNTIRNHFLPFLPGPIRNVERINVLANGTAAFNAATHFTRKTNGVSVHSNFVGDLQDGSFVEFPIRVTNAGAYRISVRAATGQDGRTIRVFDGENSLGVIQAGNTVGWHSWAAREIEITLPAGERTLRLVANGAVNIENISITGQHGATSVNHARVKSHINSATITNGQINLSLALPAREANISLYDIRGRSLFERNVAVNGNLANVALPRTIRNQTVILQVKTNTDIKFTQKMLVK